MQRPSFGLEECDFMTAEHMKALWFSELSFYFLVYKLKIVKAYYKQRGDDGKCSSADRLTKVVISTIWRVQLFSDLAKR